MAILPVKVGSAVTRSVRVAVTFPSITREWRNRQTRTVQVRVLERVWGFNSPLAHIAVLAGASATVQLAPEP